MKSARKVHLTLCTTMTLLALLSGTGQTAGKASAGSHTSITNDPATNAVLRTFSTAIPNNPAAEALREVVLSTTLAQQCAGATVSRKRQKAILQKSGYAGLSGKARDDASFLANNAFVYFDYNDIERLCPGIDYMFGPKGVLAKDLMRPGKGVPSFAEDPLNPYIQPKAPANP